jgi:hypothetical protein
MKTISPAARKRLEMQGFVDMSDADLAEIRPWLRVSPVITVLWMAAGLFLGSAKVIWAMIPFSIAGAILPGHPFDVFYNYRAARWNQIEIEPYRMKSCTWAAACVYIDEARRLAVLEK